MVLLVGALTFPFPCMMLLVCAHHYIDLQHPDFSKIGSFGDLGYAVSGPLGHAAFDSMIVLSQSGFCISYLIFIANTLAHLFRVSSWDLLAPKSIYIWGMFSFQLGLYSIKMLTHLALLSIFADIVNLGAMGVVIGKDLSILLNGELNLQAFNGYSVILYGLGVVVYAFEGIGHLLSRWICLFSAITKQ